VPGCTTRRRMLYRTQYSFLPEAKPSGSKHVHVEDIVKMTIKFSLKKGAFFELDI